MRDVMLQEGEYSIAIGGPLKRRYTLTLDGFVRLEGSPKVLGRVSGYGFGTAWYQIAAQPFDEPSVGGIDTKEAAFDELVAELERRREA